MSDSVIDVYLSDVGEPQRTTLQVLRERILQVVPDAEEVMAYGAPAFKVGGKTVAGFAAYKNHLSYLPHSGTVLGGLSGELSGFEASKGALKFALDDAPPADLVRKLISARMRELGMEPPPGE